MNVPDRKRQVIYFFFPYRTIGGVSVLFLRMAHALAHHPCSSDMDLVLIDYADGYMATHIQHPCIRLEALEAGRPIVIPKDAVFVCQSLPLWRLPRQIEFHPAARFLLWHLHPMNIVPGHFTNNIVDLSITGRAKHFLRSLLYHKQSRQCTRLLQAASAYQGLWFMDHETCRVAEHANRMRIKSPRFLPVPASKPKAGQKLDTSFKDANYGWLGRLEDFKIPILLYTLQRVARYSNDRNLRVIFHIIGDGKEKPIVTELCHQLTKDNPLFTTVFYGDVHPAAIDQILSDQLSLLFAMGTSALEGAKLGLPTVLLDFSYETITGDYVFGLLPKTQGYTLGRLIRPELLEAGNSSLENILDNLSRDFQAMSQEALAYFENNHGLDSVLQTFIGAIQHTRFTYETARKICVLELDWLVRVFYKAKQIRTGWEYRIT